MSYFWVSVSVVYTAAECIAKLPPTFCSFPQHYPSYRKWPHDLRFFISPTSLTRLGHWTKELYVYDVDNSLQHSPLCPCRNINWVIDRSQKSRDFFLSSTSREPVINILESQYICCIQSTTWLHCSQRATCTHNWQDKSVLPICTHYNFHATLLHLLISPWDSCLVLRDLLFLHIIMHNEQTLFSPLDGISLERPQDSLHAFDTSLRQPSHTSTRHRVVHSGSSSDALLLRHQSIESSSQMHQYWLLSFNANVSADL